MQVVIVLEGGAGEDAGEAEDVAEELQQVRQLVDRELLAGCVHLDLLGVMIGGEDSLAIISAVVEIVREGSQLHGDNHLSASEVEDSRKVAHIHAVDVGHSHVTHNPHKHDLSLILLRRESTKEIGDDGGDESVDPIRTKYPLQKHEADEKGEEVLGILIR